MSHFIGVLRVLLLVEGFLAFHFSSLVSNEEFLIGEAELLGWKDIALRMPWVCFWKDWLSSASIIVDCAPVPFAIDQTNVVGGGGGGGRTGIETVRVGRPINDGFGWE